MRMINEEIELKVDYKKAGVSDEGCRATLTCYGAMPNDELVPRKHRALVVCPGGGYDWCSEREAEPVAFRFLGAGIHVFILRYSCVKKKFPTALIECAAAVKYIRDNAEKYDIDPDKIVVAGFSAGGHLAASMANFWSDEIVTKALGCEASNLKINGSLLCYPVITSNPKYTHEGSILNLIGEDEKSEELRKFISMEDRVNKNTPPTFIWHCADDGCVRVENSMFYMTSLAKYSIPFESHIYEWGGHGLSLCDETTSSGDWHIQPVDAHWVQAAIDWIKRL